MRTDTDCGLFLCARHSEEEWTVPLGGCTVDKTNKHYVANSVRHNLSLHDRFLRIHNEGTGKSSWWMLNPDSKPGKSTRRRANTTVEGSRLEKKRGRTKKRNDSLKTFMEPPTSPNIAEGMTYFPSSPLTPVHHFSFQHSPCDYSSRASSSTSSSSRLSPTSAMETDSNNLHESHIGSMSPGIAGWGSDYWSNPKYHPRLSNHPQSDHQPHHQEPYSDHLINSMSHNLKIVSPESWAYNYGHLQSAAGMRGHLEAQQSMYEYFGQQPTSYGNYENSPMPTSYSAYCAVFPHSASQDAFKSVQRHHTKNSAPAQDYSTGNCRRVSPPSYPYSDTQIHGNCEMEARPSNVPNPTVPEQCTAANLSLKEKSSKFPPKLEDKRLESNKNISIKQEDNYKYKRDELPPLSRGGTEGSSCARTSVSNEKSEKEPLPESKTMFNVAISHREAQSCLMNAPPLYRHNAAYHNPEFFDDVNFVENFECNVEEVIKHELEHEDELNFDLERNQSSCAFASSNDAVMLSPMRPYECSVNPDATQSCIR